MIIVDNYLILAIKHLLRHFFKQWGGTNKKKSGRLLDGKTWEEFPK
jgi:protein gp37